MRTRVRTTASVVDVRRWGAVAVATAIVAFLLEQLGMPSHTVIGASIVGVAVALRFPRQHLVVGERPARVAQAVIGVGLGATLTASTLPQLGALWLPVTAITLATLLLAVALGLLLRRVSGLDVATAVLACVPGGAVGLVVMAREMDADDRLVAFSQYLRVLMILVATPLFATALVGAHGGGGSAGAPVVEAGVGAAAVAAALAVGGSVLARAARLAAPSLLGPMILAAALAIALPAVAVHVPQAVLEGAFALVGLDVGLRFTGDVVQQLGRLMPVLGLCIALLLALSFVLALALTATTSVSLLDAYLATTPGGLTVVAATAYGTGANTALVSAIQMIRLIVMLAAAPVLVRLTVGAVQRRDPHPTQAPSRGNPVEPPG